MSVVNLSWGLPVVDRLDKIHLASRVSLPKSVVDYGKVAATKPSKRRLPPVLAQYMAIAAFMTCGGFIIAVASFLALNIN